MPYVARVVAIVTSRGMLYCLPCADVREVSGKPQMADNGAMAREPCDGCGRADLYDPHPARYVHVEPSWTRPMIYP